MSSTSPPARLDPLRVGEKDSLNAFSLIELLVVIAIVVLMAGLLGPALNAFKGAGSLTKSAADLAGLLEQARSYAMAQNTYVFVGLHESDGSKSDTLRPAPAGVGRLWVGVVASKDGTKGYDQASWSSSNLLAISKIQILENTHLTNQAGFSSSNMATAGVVFLPSSNAVTPFGWPVGSQSSVAGFGSVIQFDPRGSASIPGETSIPEFLQIALLPARGSRVDASSANGAVIQIDGITGRVRTFRP